MLNGDSSPVKTFFKLTTLEVNSTLKTTMDSRERVCQKNWIWLLDYKVSRFTQAIGDPTQQRYSVSPCMVFL